MAHLCKSIFNFHFDKFLSIKYLVLCKSSLVKFENLQVVQKQDKNSLTSFLKPKVNSLPFYLLSIFLFIKILLFYSIINCHVVVCVCIMSFTSTKFMRDFISYLSKIFLINNTLLLQIIGREILTAVPLIMISIECFIQKRR